MNFLEDLPPSCPPAECECKELSGVYRLLKGAAPVADDWLSHMQLGKVCPTQVDPCRWASLSLQASKVAVKKLCKLPNFRGVTHAAKLDIPETAGVFLTNRNHHDFWQDRAANMNEYVCDIVEVGNG